MGVIAAICASTVKGIFHAALYVLLTAGLGAWLWGVA